MRCEKEVVRSILYHGMLAENGHNSSHNRAVADALMWSLDMGLATHNVTPELYATIGDDIVNVFLAGAKRGPNPVLEVSDGG